MFEARESGIPGCVELTALRFRDRRGVLVKTFQSEWFRRLGLETAFHEQYFTVSPEHVLRGLHFQVPPHDIAKLVTCVQGSVMDVVVDLRQGSPTFGQHRVFNLSADKANQVYIPAGLAHGYYVSSPSAIVLYAATGVHAPQADGGIHWNSAGISWPITDPIISDRDAGLMAMADFKTPFRYNSA